MLDGRVNILDIFSGSGCIGIAVLKALLSARVYPDSVPPSEGVAPATVGRLSTIEVYPDSVPPSEGVAPATAGRLNTIGVDFAEINPAFVEQIKINLEKNGFDWFRESNRPVRFPKPIIRIYQSDLFESVPEGNRYDYILANPPYVGEHDPIDEEVVRYEPHGAVFAGEDGLACIRRLVREAPAFLKPDGELWFEFAPYQKDAIAALVRFRESNKMLDSRNLTIQFHEDQYGRWRYAVVRRAATAE